jgi:hypothetical protein
MVDTDKVTTEVVQFTDKFHSYRISHGPQYNAGERAQVSSREAERLVAEGAAVRISVADTEATGGEKALAHPIKDKMVKQEQTK